MFKKILIANRGEIAVRLSRACRELNISPVAIYSEADSSSLHVRTADEAHCVGSAPASESYLNIENILEAAEKSGAEAIHPGYGFLAENHRFAAACRDSGLTFIGPPTDAIRLMGDKVASRRRMLSAGVPVVPGTAGAVAGLEEARAFTRENGLPVVIKASAGGGGKGMRVVRSEAELASSFESARGEAQSAFGDPTLYLEKYIERPRHIEVQLLGDHQGELVHLGERECSIQRRHQKLVEECPSPVVTPSFRQKLGETALEAARAVDYDNAGTVEFLADLRGEEKDWKFYFLEMNTRLQVEHPVTELVTGFDLVQEQIRIAAGRPLTFSQNEVEWKGAAIECRIYAEDPDQNFMPSPGLIRTLFEPSGAGIRMDSGVYQGYEVPVHYDPLIAKLVAYGSDRTQAISRLRRALAEYRISGPRTTIPFLHRLVTHPHFEKGKIHTHFIDEQRAALFDATDEPNSEPPLIAAAIYYSLKKKAALPRLDVVRRSGWRKLGWRRHP